MAEARPEMNVYLKWVLKLVFYAVQLGLLGIAGLLGHETYVQGRSAFGVMTFAMLASFVAAHMSFSVGYDTTGEEGWTFYLVMNVVLIAMLWFTYAIGLWDAGMAHMPLQEMVPPLAWELGVPVLIGVVLVLAEVLSGRTSHAKR